MNSLEPVRPGYSSMLEMRSCPRTRVDWSINPVRWPDRARASGQVRGRGWPAGQPRIVAFDWEAIAFELGALPIRGRRLQRLQAQRDVLEDAWSVWALQGAIRVYPWRKSTPPSDVTRSWEGGPRQSCVWCTYPLLALNVLGRTRGGLLLPCFPLSLTPEFLQRHLATDDPRLLRLAHAYGVKSNDETE